MSKISKVIARQIFDSRGNPTIEAEVFSKNISSRAICPSGASTGTYEAYEKRDFNNKKYLGKSVFKPIGSINSKISKKLKNKNVHNQELIDSLLINLDGTKQKNNLGANAILAVSMAVKKLSAKIKKIPLYKTFLVKKNFQLPYPLMNIINGGAHADNGLRIQEFMIRPDKAKSFSEAMRISFLVIQNLRSLIKKKKLSTSVGDEGGFAPMISSNNQALDLIVTAIKKSGFKNGKDVSICLDVAANELFKENKYSIHSKKFISVDKSIKEYLKIINKYKIKSLEDPFAENDWTAWNKIMNFIGKVQIVGDDPQDLKYNGEETKLIIGDNNKIREYVTINPGTEGGGGLTKIGNNCLFMISSHIAHDCYVGNNAIIANNVPLGGHAIIEDNVVIGGNSAVQQFTRIGKMAMIGGMTGVLHDVIPYGLSTGNRNALQGLNLIGLRRAKFDNKDILGLSEAYKEIFATKNLTENISKLNGAFKENPLVKNVIEFITKDKKRSICTPFS